MGGGGGLPNLVRVPKKQVCYFNRTPASVASTLKFFLSVIVSPHLITHSIADFSAVQGYSCLDQTPKPPKDAYQAAAL